MNKSDRYLAMSCYRYAPESFEAYRIIGFKDQNKTIPVREKINLTFYERQELGNLFICQGNDQAKARLKHILREQAKREFERYLMGFYLRDSNWEFVYLKPAATFKQYDLAGMYNAYKELKRAMNQDCWKIQTSKTVKLDKHYRPVKETETEGFIFVDPERPVKIKIIKSAA